MRPKGPFITVENIDATGLLETIDEQSSWIDINGIDGYGK